MRAQLERKISEENLLRAARLIAEQKFHRMKIYEMIGAPHETADDADELVRFVTELAGITRITLTFSTFVAKRNTPLDGSPFLGIREAEERLRTIRRGLRGRVQMRPQPPKWAYVEYELAQRGVEVGYAAIEAVYAGGSFAAWKRSLGRLGPNKRTLVYGNERAVARRRGLAQRPVPLRTIDRGAS